MAPANSVEQTSPESYRIVVLISGRGSNLEALLQAKEKNNLPASIAAVISDNPKALGLKHAESRNIETRVVRRSPSELNIAEFNAMLAEAVKSFEPDLVVLAGFMRILTKEFISEFPGRIINIHPSLLPLFKGLHPQRQALEAGVCISGCSVHLVTEEVDAGPIIAQAAVPVDLHDSEETLSARILTAEHVLLPTVVARIAKGEIYFEIKNDAFVVRSVRHSTLSDIDDTLLSIL